MTQNMRAISVGKVAVIVGCDIATVRYWEQHGVIASLTRMEETQHRRYPLAEAYKLRQHLDALKQARGAISRQAVSIDEQLVAARKRLEDAKSELLCAQMALERMKARGVDAVTVATGMMQVKHVQQLTGARVEALYRHVREGKLKSSGRLHGCGFNRFTAESVREYMVERGLDTTRLDALITEAAALSAPEQRTA